MEHQYSLHNLDSPGDQIKLHHSLVNLHHQSPSNIQHVPDNSLHRPPSPGPEDIMMIIYECNPQDVMDESVKKLNKNNHDKLLKYQDHAYANNFNNPADKVYNKEPDNHRIDELKQTILKLKKDLNTKNKTIEQNNNTINQLTEDNKLLNEKMNEIKTENNSLREHVSSLEALISILNATPPSDPCDDTVRNVVVYDPEGNKGSVVLNGDLNIPNLDPPDDGKPFVRRTKRGLYPRKRKMTETYSCPRPGCDHVTPYKNNLKKHIETVHDDIRPFPCQLCSYTAHDPSQLKRHIVLVHKKEDKHLKCHLCPLMFYETSKLKIHISTIHEGIRRQCHICKKCFIDKARLLRHIANVHDGSKPYRCPHCNHTTAQKNNLKTHIMGVHMNVKPFVCNICQYAASEKATMGRHMKNIHGADMSICKAPGQYGNVTLEKIDLGHLI